MIYIWQFPASDISKIYHHFVVQTCGKRWDLSKLAPSKAENPSCRLLVDVPAADLLRYHGQGYSGTN